MQDIHPDVVSPDELVNEILRRQGSSSSPPHPPQPSSDEDMEITRIRRGSAIERAMSVEEDDPLSQEVTSFASTSSEVVILDCQNPCDFQECHIRGALNVTFPAIMIRRIAAGKIDIFEKSKELKAKIANAKITFVVYDAFHQGNQGSTPGELSDLVHLIARKLAQNGCPVATLNGTDNP